MPWAVSASLVISTVMRLGTTSPLSRARPVRAAPTTIGVKTPTKKLPKAIAFSRPLKISNEELTP